jgi:mono/diheme cytochrome c family protein
MANVGRYLCCGTALAVLLTTGIPAQADQGKDLYEKQCAGCHTIGGGDSGGPDLKGVVGKRPSAWLERVIVEPDKLTAEKDPVQAELVKKYGFEMPNLGISRDDAKKIIAYMKGGAPAAPAATAQGSKTAATGPAAPAAPATPAAAGTSAVPAEQPPAKAEAPLATPELIANGKALFFGLQPFSKGGAPCASCHAFSSSGMQSGNLAVDLSGIYAKMGENGVRGVLKSLKFPIMKKIYADRSLTDGEISAVTAFLADAATQKGGSASNAFPLSGFGLFALLLVGLGIYKRRIK